MKEKFDNNESFEGKENTLADFLKKMMNATGDVQDCMMQAIINDQRLLKVAEYEATKGFKLVKVMPEHIQSLFSEFKVMVEKKETTLAELETLVYSKYGILEPIRENSPLGQRSVTKIEGFTFQEKTKNNERKQNER